MLLPFTFVLTFAVSVGIALYASREPVSRRRMHTRLANIGIKTQNEDEPGLELSGRKKQELSDRISEHLTSYRFGEKIERLIVHAGSNLTVGRVVLTALGSALIFAIGAHVLFGPWAVALPAAALGGASPYLLLRLQRGRRIKKFNAALPDAIDLMARALRAGHSTGSAIEVIAQQSPKPLSTEFETCFQQQKFGIPFRDTLLAMGERVPSDDLDFLITAVLVQKETGGDLTDILDRTNAVIRDRVRIQAEVRTRTAQGRMTGWILSLLPVILLVVINVISPGYSHVLFYDPLGQKITIAGGVFILIGGFIISRIVDIRV